MIVIRDLLLTLTILSLIFIADHWPKPVKDNQVKYCPITYKAAGKDALGRWHSGWAQGYGPCSLMDRYEFI